MTKFNKPALPGAALFAALPDHNDPGDMTAVGHRVANLLVGGRDAAGFAHDDGLAERVVHLADEDGLGTIAELWLHAPANTLAGSLWRLYLLRTWVHRQPDDAAREFAAGKAFTPVDEMLAGVVDPPGPDEVKYLLDTVVRGIVSANLDVTLDRASAFARVVSVGRAHLDSGDPVSAAKLLDMSTDLRRAAELERRGELH
jgi:hypothetical protein